MIATTDLFLELANRGIVIEAHGDNLRFHPRSAVPSDLLDRMKAHKAEILRAMEGCSHSLVNGVNVYDTPTDDTESGGIVDVGAVDGPSSTYATLEIDRFFEIAEPHPSGNGFSDPAEAEMVDAIRNLPPREPDAEIDALQFVKEWNERIYRQGT